MNVPTFNLWAAAALGLGLSTAAPAAALTLLPGPGCDVSQLTTSTACAGTYDGNDANQSLDGLFSESGWTEIYKVDSHSGTDDILTVTADAGADKVSGSWSITGNWGGLSKVMAVLKGGDSFSAYLLDLAYTSGDWTTQGLAKGNGKPGPGLSHFTLYGLKGDTPPPSQIPLPAGGVLLLTALGGLALARRRKA